MTIAACRIRVPGLVIYSYMRLARFARPFDWKSEVSMRFLREGYLRVHLRVILRVILRSISEVNLTNSGQFWSILVISRIAGTPPVIVVKPCWRSLWSLHCQNCKNLDLQQPKVHT